MSGVEIKAALDGAPEFVAYAVEQLALSLGDTHPTVLVGRRIMASLDGIPDDAVLVTEETLAAAIHRAWPYRRNSATGLVLSAASILASLRAPPGPSRGQAVTISDELGAFNTAFARALAEQDAERVAGYYTNDARMLFAGEAIIRGRAAIEATIRAWVRDGPVILRFETDEVIADGSVVVDVGRIISPTGRSKYVVVYRRQPDRSLKIAVDATSSDSASPTSD